MSVMTATSNKEIVRRFYEEVMNKGDVSALRDLMAEDFRDHGETMFGESQGRDVLEKGIQAVHQILPDLGVTVEEIVAEGDLVGVRGTMRCRHTGPFLGVPPTGSELTWKGLAIFRVTDGKITERWFNSDSIAIFRSLGLAPPPQERHLPL